MKQVPTLLRVKPVEGNLTFRSGLRATFMARQELRGLFQRYVE